MRRLYAATVALTCLTQVANAAISSKDTLFTSVCIDDQVGGFVWKDGAWTTAMQYPNKYTVEKVAATSSECADVMAGKADATSLFDDVTYGCYTITDFGNDPGPVIACTENWVMSDAQPALDSVNCVGDPAYEWIVFNPAGPYQYAAIGGDPTVEARDGMKDPLVVSVGKCRLAPQRGIRP